MSMPRPDEESKAFFASVIPVEPRITIKPMFGNIGSFFNGNMFAGLFGQLIFVRLPETDRSRLLEVVKSMVSSNFIIKLFQVKYLI
jgi:TfoX/Sxy family transcriptional regulator of competence genes